jgi:hypothetical protein
MKIENNLRSCTLALFLDSFLFAHAHASLCFSSYSFAYLICFLSPLVESPMNQQNTCEGATNRFKKASKNVWVNVNMWF